MNAPPILLYICLNLDKLHNGMIVRFQFQLKFSGYLFFVQGQSTLTAIFKKVGTSRLKKIRKQLECNLNEYETGDSELRFVGEMSDQYHIIISHRIIIFPSTSTYKPRSRRVCEVLPYTRANTRPLSSNFNHGAQNDTSTRYFYIHHRIIS